MRTLLIVPSSAVARSGGATASGQHRHRPNIHFAWPFPGWTERLRGLSFDTVIVDADARRRARDGEFAELRAYLDRGETVWIEL